MTLDEARTRTSFPGMGGSAPGSADLLLLPDFDNVLAVGRLAQWLARLVYTE